MNSKHFLSRSAMIVAAISLPLAVFAEGSSSSSASSASLAPSSAEGSSSSLVAPVIPLPSSCIKSPDKDRCIPDMIKSFERLKSDFVNQQARRNKEWHEKYDSMGRSDEYIKLLREFSIQMKKEGDVFFKALKEATKKIHDAQSSRSYGSSSSSKASRPTTKVDAEILKKCSTVKDERKYRICVRNLTNLGKLRPMSGKTY